MSPPLYIQGHSDTGRQREQNEDCFRIQQRPDGSWVLVVCDGMGGHEAGEVASAVASQRIVDVLVSSPTAQPPRALYDALMEANQAVVETAIARGTPGMGTTAVAAWVLGDRCYVGWVGDSRLYQFRRGRLIERSRDHTRVEQMVQHGILTPEQAKQHPDAHVLLRAIGGSAGVQQGFKPEVWNEPLELQAGDVLLLCSDGLYDLIEDAELYPLIERRDCLNAVDTLIRAANARGGTDNITAILLVAGQPDVPAMGSAPPSALRRDTIPEAPRVVVPGTSTAPHRGEAIPEVPQVASTDASGWPAPRQTLPETPLVAAPEAPAPSDLHGMPPEAPREDTSSRAAPASFEPPRVQHPVGSDVPQPRPMGTAPSGSGALRPAGVTGPPGNSRRVPMLWAMGLAAGMLLVGGLLGWVFGRGSSGEDSGPGSVMAASAASASGPGVGTNVPSASPDAGPSKVAMGGPPAPTPLPATPPGAEAGARDGGPATGGAVADPVTTPAPLVTPPVPAPAATPAPKSKKKAASSAQPVPSRPRPAAPGAPASGSAAEGQGT